MATPGKATASQDAPLSALLSLLETQSSMGSIEEKVENLAPGSLKLKVEMTLTIQ